MMYPVYNIGSIPLLDGMHGHLSRDPACRNKHKLEALAQLYLSFTYTHVRLSLSVLPIPFLQNLTYSFHVMLLYQWCQSPAATMIMPNVDVFQRSYSTEIIPQLCQALLLQVSGIILTILDMRANWTSLLLTPFASLSVGVYLVNYSHSHREDRHVRTQYSNAFKRQQRHPVGLTHLFAINTGYIEVTKPNPHALSRKRAWKPTIFQEWE